MTLATPRKTRWPGMLGFALDGLRALWQDLKPSAGVPLAPLAGQRAPWLVWLPHLLVAALAVVLGAVAGGQAASDGGAATGLAIALGIVQGLPLVTALFR